MKTKLLIITALGAAAAMSAPNANDAFLRNQAMVEVQRVANQIDVLQSNFDELSAAVGKANKYEREISSLKSDMEALRGAVENLRREMAEQRAAIISELTKKIVEINKRQAPAPAPAPVPEPEPSKNAYSGPCREYVVAKGDTLYVVAQAFKTTVRQLKEMNNLKSDNLRIGQKLLVPGED